MALEALVPIARMHVGDLTGADLSTTDVVTCSRSQWAADTLDSYRPLFTDLATALSGATGVEEDETDPMAQMMAGLSKMMAPAMLGMAVGSMTGDLASTLFRSSRPADSADRPATETHRREHRRICSPVGNPT